MSIVRAKVRIFTQNGHMSDANSLKIVHMAVIRYEIAAFEQKEKKSK